MKSFLLLFICLPFFGVGQNMPQKHWIQFTDKQSTPHSLSNPLTFLSQRALDRRAAQNIPLTQNDLPVDPAYIQQVWAEGATVLSTSKWFNSVSVLVSDSATLKAIWKLPFVKQTQAVARFKKDRETNKEDVKSRLATAETDLASEADYGTAFNQIDMLHGVSLHNKGFMGQGMLIAVLDGGFANLDLLPVFDSLINDGRILATWDFVSQEEMVYNDASHGTMVMSTMAAYQPGAMIGTAPRASYLLLRTEDDASEFPIEEDYWVAGAEYADSAGADVINSSLGYTTFDDSSFDHTYADMDGNTTRSAIGADIAASKGMLVVCSAGNEGNSNWKHIGSPADGDSVLAIGATDKDGFRASFSSVGPSSDGDIKPNVCAQGLQATVANALGSVTSGNGTSFAGPIIAGMAACLWQAYPQLTNMQIFRAIEESGHLHSNPDFLMGHGIPNFALANLQLSKMVPKNLQEDELFKIYPNPFLDGVEGVFYSSVSQHVLVRLVNNVGQEIDRFEHNAQEMCNVPFRFLNLNHQAAGIYYLQIVTGTGSYRRKLLKL
ncbi:S8 family serine peptidase [Bacteroidota bacterium]